MLYLSSDGIRYYLALLIDRNLHELLGGYQKKEDDTSGAADDRVAPFGGDGNKSKGVKRVAPQQEAGHDQEGRRGGTGRYFWK